MHINYNENDETIEIQDRIEMHYWITNVSVIFATINCLLFPFLILKKKQVEWIGFIWIVLGIAFFIVLIYQILKVSTSRKLKLSEINALKESQFLGRKKISLILNNGKHRNLMPLKNTSDIGEIKSLFKNIGVKII